VDHEEWLQVVDEIGPGFADGAEERDATDTFVAAHYPVLKERGLIAAMIPEELGGGGAGHAAVCAMLRRLGYYDGSTALALSMHQHLIAAQAFNHRHGRPAPLLERVARDQLVLVSTGARDWLESNGSMQQVDDGFLVSARKAFASGSPAGDIAVTSAPYEDPTEGAQVLHFGVPMNDDGVRLEEDWAAHGMRSTGSQTVVLEDVFVPEGAISLRRPRGEFHDVWSVVLTVALPLIAGVYVGVAERAAEIGLGLARKRASDPTAQWSAGEMQSALLLARAGHDRMVQLANNLDFSPSLELTDEILVLKTHVVESARTAVEKALETAGGPGFYRRGGLSGCCAAYAPATSTRWPRSSSCCSRAALPSTSRRST
jgi:acyl-CoA dehydrogenase